MNTILKGSTAGPIEIRLAPGFDYAGKTVHVNYQGVTRDFPDCVAGGKLELSYGAKETAPMALGVWPIAVWITDEDGTVIRVASTESRIRVTDVPSEVHTSGVIGIEAKGVLAGIEDLPERYTDADVVAKLREILRAGGAAVRTLLVCAALLGAALLNAATVQTAPKQAIYNDQQVVTNVTFEGLATLDDLKGAGVSAEAVTNIVKAVAPKPEDYTTTNAVKDIVTNEIDSVEIISAEEFDYVGMTNAPLAISKIVSCEYILDGDVIFEGEGSFERTSYWRVVWYSDMSGGTKTGYDIYAGPGSTEITATPDTAMDWGVKVRLENRKINALGLARLADLPPLTNGLARTSDIPSTAADVGATTPEDVTAAIREQSLGGIWDDELQVWWTPRMRNGSLTYEATTNVNLNAEN